MSNKPAEPNFFLVGVVKGGTTSLHQYLDAHPEVYMSPLKETNYFAKEEIDPALFTKDYAHDVAVDLERFFAEGMQHKIHIAHIEHEADYLRLFGNVREEKAIGEASASYMIYPGVAQRIHARYPEAKILMILRDPAERAFSQYVMNLRLGKTLEQDFLTELTRDEASAHQGWGANHQYLRIGFYYEQVKRYLDLFGSGQVMICWYDDYKADAGAIMRKIYRFLGVDEEFLPDTSEKLNTAGIPRFARVNYWINQSGLISWAKRTLPRGWREPFKRWMYFSNNARIPRMSEAERAHLTGLYRDDILRLQALTGRDLSAWLAVR